MIGEIIVLILEALVFLPLYEKNEKIPEEGYLTSSIRPNTQVKMNKKHIQCLMIVLYGVVYSNDGIVDEEEQALIDKAFTERFKEWESFIMTFRHDVLRYSNKLVHTLFLLEKYNIPLIELENVVKLVRKELKSMDREYYGYDEYLMKLIMRYKKRVSK